MNIRSQLIALVVSSISFLLLGSSWQCTTGQNVHPPIDADSAWVIVTERVLQDFGTKVRIYVSQKPIGKEEKIKAVETEYAIPETFTSAWLFFVDDAPDANWEHPCRYILVDTVSGNTHVIEGKLPPDNFDQMKKIHPAN